MGRGGAGSGESWLGERNLLSQAASAEPEQSGSREGEGCLGEGGGSWRMRPRDYGRHREGKCGQRADNGAVVKADFLCTVLPV